MSVPFSPSQYLGQILETNAIKIEDAVKITGLMACTLRGILNTSVRVDKLNASGLGQLPPPVGSRKYCFGGYHAKKWLKIQSDWDDYTYVPPEIVIENGISIEDKMKPIIGNIREKILSWNK